MKSILASTLAFTAFMTRNGMSATALSFPEDTPKVQADLLLAEWEFDNKNIGSYDYEYFRHGVSRNDGRACPLTVQIRDYKLDTTLDCNGEEIMTSPPPPTMDQLYNLIQEAINSKAVSVEVTYDQEYGVPTDIHIDYVDGKTSDNILIEVSNFEFITSYDIETENERVDHARQLWKDEVGSKSYMFEFEEHCPHCAQEHFPWAVTVHNSIISEVYDNRSNTPQNIYLVETIAELFDRIETAVHAPVRVLDVTYDDKLGYPVSVYIDNGVHDYSVSVRDVFIYE